MKNAEARNIKREYDPNDAAADDRMSSSVHKSYVPDDQMSSSGSMQGSTRRTRGPYRKYDEITKRAAITMAKQSGYDFTAVSKKLKIPAKNIKRWIASGAVRKKGNLLSLRREKDPRPKDGVEPQ